MDIREERGGERTDLFWNQIWVWRSCMPSISLISFRLAAVGLRSMEKRRSRWESCSGVTRDRLRFSRSGGAPPGGADFGGLATVAERFLPWAGWGAEMVWVKERGRPGAVKDEPVEGVWGPWAESTGVSSGSEGDSYLTWSSWRGAGLESAR